MVINSKEELKELISTSRKKGKKVLIKKGVFDIIHPGHIHAIKMFTKQCDVLIILVISDESVKIKKGEKRPINPQKQRLEVMNGLEGVDYVYPDKTVSREEYIELLKFLKPDIVAVTSVDDKKTKAYSAGSWKLLEFPDKKKPGYSTTEIIKRIAEHNCCGSNNKC